MFEVGSWRVKVGSTRPGWVFFSIFEFAFRFLFCVVYAVHFFLSSEYMYPFLFLIPDPCGGSTTRMVQVLIPSMRSSPLSYFRGCV